MTAEENQLIEIVLAGAAREDAGPKDRAGVQLRTRESRDTPVAPVERRGAKLTSRRDEEPPLRLAAHG